MKKKKKPTVKQQITLKSAEGTATTSHIGKYTLERIRAKKPAMLEAAVEMLGAGMSENEVHMKTGFCRNTVSRIMIEYADKIAPLNQHQAEQCKRVATMATEAARQALDKHLDPDDDFTLPPNLLPVYTGVYTEKYLLLSGDVTSRTETVKKKVDYAHIDEVMKDLAGVTEIMDINPTIIKQEDI